MGESTSYSMMGSVLKQSQDREGVRIDAPHGWVINDVHHAWTKNETYHWETGNIFHMTSGQVYHANLNLAEVHTTTNALTMHVDMTPIQVHMNQGLSPVKLEVHLEPCFNTRTHHIHKGKHGSHFNELEQEAGEIKIHAVRGVHEIGGIPLLSKFMAGLESMAGIKPTPGTLSLTADGEMTLLTKETMALCSATTKSSTSLLLDGDRGLVRLESQGKTVVQSSEETLVQVGESTIVLLKNNSCELLTKDASVTLGDGKLTTNAPGGTRLTGKVSLGEASIIEVDDGRAARAAAAAAAAAEEQRLAEERRQLFSELPG
jgi:hypothetical protein